MITQIVLEQMHPADIQALLKKSGTSQIDIAKALDTSETNVYQVIKGRSTSCRVAEFIAKKINKSLDEIWPGRYSNDQSS